jgi:hypothetical protein
MNKPSEIDAIEARHREIVAEIERLQKEADELDIAVKVFRRFSASGAQPDQASTRLGPPRPEGIPSLFVMTATVLREARVAGNRNGLTGKEIVDEIRNRWWPGLNSQQVLPTIYQFAKRGRLIKSVDGRFRALPNDEVLSARTESTSEVTGEVPASPNESREAQKGILG